MTPEEAGRGRSHGLNALIGYSVGTGFYFLFLWMAALAEHYGVFRGASSRGRGDFVSFCTFGPSLPFWYRAVSDASLDHRRQPTVLYLTALLLAGIFAAIRRPFGSHRLPGLRANVASGTVFGAAALVNLWFSLSNLGLRFWRG